MPRTHAAGIWVGTMRLRRRSGTCLSTTCAGSSHFRRSGIGGTSRRYVPTLDPPFTFMTWHRTYEPSRCGPPGPPGPAPCSSAQTHTSKISWSSTGVAPRSRSRCCSSGHDEKIHHAHALTAL